MKNEIKRKDFGEKHFYPEKREIRIDIEQKHNYPLERIFKVTFMNNQEITRELFDCKNDAIFLREIRFILNEIQTSVTYNTKNLEEVSNKMDLYSNEEDVKQTVYDAYGIVKKSGQKLAIKLQHLIDEINKI